MNCTRCQGTGFLNVEQLPDGMLDEEGVDAVYEWLDNLQVQLNDMCCTCFLAAPCSFCMLQTDVQVCDCCGDGVDWYGEPGRHYGPDDMQGLNGPYGYNGGLAECH